MKGCGDGTRSFASDSGDFCAGSLAFDEYHSYCASAKVVGEVGQLGSSEFAIPRYLRTIGVVFVLDWLVMTG